MTNAPAWPVCPGDWTLSLIRLPTIAVFGDADSMSLVK